MLSLTVTYVAPLYLLIIFAIEKEHSVRLDTWRKSPLAFREQILSARGTRFRKPVQVQDY